MIIIVAVAAVVIAVLAAFLWWLSRYYFETPGGLAEKDARTACEDEARSASGFGEDAELDTWSASIVSDQGWGASNDHWSVEGQIFEHSIDGVDATDGSRDDGVEFSCTVGEESAKVELAR